NLSLLGTGVINGTGNAGGNRLTGNGVANKLDGLEGADTIDGGLGNDIITGGGGADSIDASKGNDRLVYTEVIDAGDTVTGFDANPVGGQDIVDLDALFDNLLIAPGARAGRVALVDNAGSTEVRVDVDGVGGDFEVLLVTLANAPVATVSVGADVVLGS
ncbi:MAG TPA: hypothetical protein VH835_14390, partial [Dongiaceae bacterium]